MKGISNFLLVIGCLAIATQATYLRVIHAVPPGDMRMDVYYTAMDTGEKIRLFQDLNYTDIPPYFFIPVLQNREQVTLSFLLKPSLNTSSELLHSQEELQGLPSHTITLRRNLTYTLVVTSSSQQGQDQGLESQGNQSGQNQGNQSNLQYLLLNDYSQGDEAPQGMKFVRLINVAEDASSISLIEANGECSEESMNNTQGSQDQEDQGEGSQDQGSAQGGNQMEQNEPLAQQLGFLESSDYIELPQASQPTSLFVCYQGQKIPVTPAPLYRASGSKFSILLFTGPQQQSQGSQEQEQGSQQEHVAYVVSDEPVTIQNVRIRIVHAESSLPSVNVMLDGQQIFDRVTFGNVTEYYMTVRGIHNISVSLASGQMDQGLNSSSVRIVTFFAWTKSYSIAIVRTSSGNIGIESQGSQEDQSGDQGLEGNQSGSQDLTAGQPTQLAGISFPGFQGNLHKIFLDDFSQNATLGNNYAYVQFVHLASNVGAVNVRIGDQNITNIRFLQSSLYRSVLASGQNIPIQVVLASSNTPVFSLSTSLQPGTLYTLWALQDSRSGSTRIFLTTDRQIQVQCVVLDKEMMSGQASGNQSGNEGQQDQGDQASSE